MSFNEEGKEFSAGSRRVSELARSLGSFKDTFLNHRLVSHNFLQISLVKQFILQQRRKLMVEWREATMASLHFKVWFSVLSKVSGVKKAQCWSLAQFLVLNLMWKMSRSSINHGDSMGIHWNVAVLNADVIINLQIPWKYPKQWTDTTKKYVLPIQSLIYRFLLCQRALNLQRATLLHCATCSQVSRCFRQFSEPFRKLKLYIFVTRFFTELCSR